MAPSVWRCSSWNTPSNLTGPSFLCSTCVDVYSCPRCHFPHFSNGLFNSTWSSLIASACVSGFPCLYRNRQATLHRTHNTHHHPLTYLPFLVTFFLSGFAYNLMETAQTTPLFSFSSSTVSHSCSFFSSKTSSTFTLVICITLNFSFSYSCPS